MAEKAILTIGDRQFELPIVEGVEGDRGIDISRLRDTTGMVTYDPSLGNTAVCRSAITFIDGEQGILRYRGIPIEQFTEKPNFVEVAYLLIFGKLPNHGELKDFSARLTENELLHEGLKHQYQHIPVDAPPMAILSATLSNLACFHPQFLALEDPESFIEAAARLISKVRTIAAFSYRRSRGMPFVYPDPHLRYCANFLHMMFSIPYKQYIVTREIEDRGDHGGAHLLRVGRRRRREVDAAYGVARRVRQGEAVLRRLDGHGNAVLVMVGDTPLAAEGVSAPGAGDHPPVHPQGRNVRTIRLYSYHYRNLLSVLCVCASARSQHPQSAERVLRGARIMAVSRITCPRGDTRRRRP